MAKPRGAPIWGRRRPRPSEVSRGRSESKPGPRNAADGFAIADCGQRPLDDPSLGDLSLDSPSRWANRKRSACERKAPLRGPWPSVRNGRARHAHWRAGVHIAFRHSSMGIQGGSQRQQGMRRTRPAPHASGTPRSAVRGHPSETAEHGTLADARESISRSGIHRWESRAEASVNRGCGELDLSVGARRWNTTRTGFDPQSVPMGRRLAAPVHAPEPSIAPAAVAALLSGSRSAACRARRRHIAH